MLSELVPTPKAIVEKCRSQVEVPLTRAERRRLLDFLAGSQSSNVFSPLREEVRILLGANPKILEAYGYYEEIKFPEDIRECLAEAEQNAQMGFFNSMNAEIEGARDLARGIEERGGTVDRTALEGRIAAIEAICYSQANIDRRLADAERYAQMGGVLHSMSGEIEGARGLAAGIEERHGTVDRPALERRIAAIEATLPK